MRSLFDFNSDEHHAEIPDQCQRNYDQPVHVAKKSENIFDQNVHIISEEFHDEYRHKTQKHKKGHHDHKEFGVPKAKNPDVGKTGKKQAC